MVVVLLDGYGVFVSLSGCLAGGIKIIQHHLTKTHFSKKGKSDNKETNQQTVK